MVVPLRGVEGLEIELSWTKSSPGSVPVSGGFVLVFSLSMRLAWLSVWKDVPPTPTFPLKEIYTSLPRLTSTPITRINCMFFLLP